MIRQATIWDANKIAELWFEMSQEVMTQETIKPEYENKDQLLLNVFCRINDINWKILVSEEDSIIIGFLMVHLRYPDYNNCHKILQAETIYVQKQHRNLFIFQQLMDECDKWALPLGASIAETICNYEPKIMKFYEYLGFEPVQVVMRKKIGG